MSKTRRTWTVNVRLVVGVVFVSALSIPAPALALEPYPCNWSSINKSAPFVINMDYWKHDWEMGNGANYSNLTHWYWPVLMNANIKKILVTYDQANSHTWNSFDHFGIQKPDLTWYWENQDFPTTSPLLETVRGQYNYYSKSIMEWDSTEMGSDKGVRTMDMYLECDTGSFRKGNSYTHTDLMRNLDIVLVDQGDTVYFKITQPANYPLAVTMKKLAATANADFDFYATASSVTTPGPSPDTCPDPCWTGTSYAPSEAKIIPASTSSRTIKFAVTSYQGAGHVRMNITPITNEHSDLWVCMASGFDPTSQDETKILNMVVQGMQYWFGMFDGQDRYPQVDVLFGYIPGCNVYVWGCEFPCGSPCDSVGRSCTSNGVVHIEKGSWSGVTLAHELGHAVQEFPDEYWYGGSCDQRPWCGHTIMGAQMEFDICTNENHKEDSYPGCSKSSADPTSEWYRYCYMSSLDRPCYSYRTGTPNRSDYINMDNFVEDITGIHIYY